MNAACNEKPTEPVPPLLSPWPIPRRSNWVERAHEPLMDKELAAIRRCAQWGSPPGNSIWIESIVHRLGLESTLRPRGRPQVRPLKISYDNSINKES